jgi:putative sterol carrier protein
MMSELTINELMSRMPRAFLPEKAVGVEAVVQYHLTGEQGGDWVITIKDGACTVEPGETAEPSLTLTADSQDYLGMFTGETNAMQAFMQGKLKLAGDLNLAMKLLNFFKMR